MQEEEDAEDAEEAMVQFLSNNLEMLEQLTRKIGSFRQSRVMSEGRQTALLEHKALNQIGWTNKRLGQCLAGREAKGIELYLDAGCRRVWNQCSAATFLLHT